MILAEDRELTPALLTQLLSLHRNDTGTKERATVGEMPQAISNVPLEEFASAIASQITSIVLRQV